MQVTPQLALTLANFTNRDLIIPSLQGRTTGAVIHELVNALHRVEAVPGLLHASLAALNNELLTSTSLDGGAICAQIRSSANQPRFALGRSADALRWRASFYPPIDLVLLVVKPVKESNEAGRLCIALRAFGKNTPLLNRLRTAHNTDEMLAVLAQYSV